MPVSLSDLQASKVIVEDEQGRKFRLTPSFRVGEFQLQQLPQVREEEVAPEVVQVQEPKAKRSKKE